MRLKITLSLAVLVSISSLLSSAEGSVAQNPIFLHQLRDEVKNITNERGGKWSYDFTLIRANGDTELLSGSESTFPAIPASTLKIFPAWFAYRQKIASDDYIAKMLKRSDNRMASGLTRKLGGARKLSEAICDEPLIRDSKHSFRLVDGSGLSSSNRITAKLEVLFLRTIFASGELYDGFKTLLARPGQYGTLKGRFSQRHRETLFAKTGTLPQVGVASLAGFLETEQGVVAFSIIGNELNPKRSRTKKRRRARRQIREGRDTIDQIVDLHAAYLKQT